MQIWGLTDIGLVRRDNQDAYRIGSSDSSGHQIAVVCDGMGGMRGGSIASNIAADVFLHEVQTNLRGNMTPEQIREVASFATSVANTAIRSRAAEDELLTGMGTTLVSAISYGDGVVVSNVGDSRAYHISEAGIRRVSKDHSLVEKMIDNGDITAEEARNHPQRNYITRALGPEESTLCDGFVVSANRGDYILLCTDGLVETVTDEEMQREILQAERPEDSLIRMLEISRRHGAPDNVTAVLMKME